jgi:ABC-type molybdate transport system ATPase subunit
VRTLSGGNQQKVIIGRELLSQPTVLLASQPTRGVDIGAIEFIHSQLVAHRDAGAAILLVSAELDEIRSLSDRIAVMYEGRIVSFEPANAPEERLGLLMAGGGHDRNTPLHRRTLGMVWSAHASGCACVFILARLSRQARIRRPQCHRIARFRLVASCRAGRW